MTRFFLIRHASTNSLGQYLSGRQPGVYLNEQGILESNNLCKNLSAVPIKAIYCSPLERAVETAVPLSKLFNLTTVFSKGLMEIDFGSWTNMAFKDLASDPQFQLFNSFRSCTRIPDGESMAEAQLRIVTVLQELTLIHQEQNIAIISHADLIKSVIAYFFGIPLDMMQRIEISPASVSIIELHDDTAKLCLVNNTGPIR
jgi:broad specificity phosphatase PhoE